MKIQYQFRYRKMFKNIYMYLPVQAQSNPKLSYFEHVCNFSDIFQSINNITMVVIGIYTLTQIISHHYMLNLKVRYVYYITRAHFQTDNYTQ